MAFSVCVLFEINSISIDGVIKWIACIFSLPFLETHDSTISASSWLQLLDRTWCNMNTANVPLSAVKLSMITWEWMIKPRIVRMTSVYIQVCSTSIPSTQSRIHLEFWCTIGSRLLHCSIKEISQHLMRRDQKHFNVHLHKPWIHQSNIVPAVTNHWIACEKISWNGQETLSRQLTIHGYTFNVNNLVVQPRICTMLKFLHLRA